MLHYLQGVECALSLKIVIGLEMCFDHPSPALGGQNHSFYHPLIFFWLKEFAVLFVLMQSSLYFLCLETKKVTKKIQARPDALPAGQANAHEEWF